MYAYIVGGFVALLGVFGVWWKWFRKIPNPVTPAEVAQVDTHIATAGGNEKGGDLVVEGTKPIEGHIEDLGHELDGVETDIEKHEGNIEGLEHDPEPDKFDNVDQAKDFFDAIKAEAEKKGKVQ